jgi:hypothetical protein
MERWDLQRLVVVRLLVVWIFVVGRLLVRSFMVRIFVVGRLLVRSFMVRGLMVWRLVVRCLVVRGVLVRLELVRKRLDLGARPSSYPSSASPLRVDASTADSSATAWQQDWHNEFGSP